VIVGPASAVQVAKSITTTIPLVFVAADDPIKLGSVESLNRPGGSTTGVYMFNVVPTATTFGVLINPNYPAAEVQLGDVQNAAIRIWGVPQSNVSVSPHKSCPVCIVATCGYDLRERHGTAGRPTILP
jgi:hypothetical protein